MVSKVIKRVVGHLPTCFPQLLLSSVPYFCLAKVRRFREDNSRLWTFSEYGGDKERTVTVQ